MPKTYREIGWRVAVACAVALAGWTVAHGGEDDAGSGARWRISVDAVPNFATHGETVVLPLTVYDTRNPMPPMPGYVARTRRDNPARVLPGGPRGEAVTLHVGLRWISDRADPDAPADDTRIPSPDEKRLATIQATPYGRERPVPVPVAWTVSTLDAAPRRFGGRLRTARFILRRASTDGSGAQPVVAAATVHVWDLARTTPLSPTPKDGADAPGHAADARRTAGDAEAFLASLPTHIDRIGREYEDAGTRGVYPFAMPERVLWRVPRRTESMARRWQTARVLDDAWRMDSTPVYALAWPGDAMRIEPSATRLPWRIGPATATASGTEKLADDAGEAEALASTPPVYGLLRQAMRWRLTQEREGTPSTPWADARLVVFPGGGDMRYGTPPHEFGAALDAVLAVFENAPTPPMRLSLATPTPLAGYEGRWPAYDRAAWEVARTRFADWIGVPDSTPPTAGTRTGSPGGESPADGTEALKAPVALFKPMPKEAEASRAQVARTLETTPRRGWGWVGLAALPLLTMAAMSLGATWLWRRARWDRVRRRIRE